MESLQDKQDSYLSERASRAIRYWLGDSVWPPPREALSKLSFSELQKTPSCGRKSLEEILSWLHSRGVKLMDEPGCRPPGPPKPHILAERYAAIVRMRDSGMTLTAIGKSLGVSRGRVSQIYRLAKYRLGRGAIMPVIQPQTGERAVTLPPS
jgi:hypothetical protein